MLRKAFILLLWSAFALAQSQVRITQGPKVEHTSATTAIIAWSTDASSGTLVKYGTDPDNLTQQAGMPWGGFTHRVTLKDLKPNTTYYFQVISGQAQGSGTTTSSDVAQFQTTAQTSASTPPTSQSPPANPPN
jgi:phosphodiesterase/alkaline phosphatase D-like protein